MWRETPNSSLSRPAAPHSVVPISAVHPSGTRDARAISPAEWADIIARVSDGEGLRKVAADVNVSHQTINRRYKADNVSASRRGPPPLMSHKGEASLVEWLQANEEMARCVPMPAFKVTAARIAADLGDAHFKAGRKWAEGFFRRHPKLASRTPEVTEHSRAYALHPHTLEEYQIKLKSYVQDRDASEIWNMDESGFDIPEISRGLKVVATKGSKQVQSVSGANRDRISFCFFFNAAGDCSPPIILLKGERKTATKLEIMKAYPEAHFIMCESATQTEETWAQCAAFFNKWVAEKYPGGNHLLLVDGHSSRVSLEAIHSFRAAGNHIFTLPPHTTHVTQPFDVAIAKAFKANLRAALVTLRLGDLENLGRSISHKNIMLAFKIAFGNTMGTRVDQKTGEKYTLGAVAFAKAGVHPFKYDIIEERYSKPAEWFYDNVVSKKPAPPTLTQDERAAVVEKHTKALLDAGDLTDLLAKHVKAKREHCVPGSTLLTGDEHIAKALALEQLKAAELAAVEERKEARKVASAASKAAKLERAARIEAKKAAKAASAGNGDDATAPAAATAPAKVPKGKGVKRKREGAPEVGLDEVEAARKGAGERRAKRNAARGDEGE